MNDSVSNPTTLADRIDAVLPQTQCTRCGYPACRDYAQAIVRDEADINQCPPGGESGIQTLANLLGRAPKPLNPANGVEKQPEVAIIDESVCIGCTKCIQACPVDAIIGTNKMMHTILADECNGCELCVPACPVDCISMQPVAAFANDAPHFKARYEVRRARLKRWDDERNAQLAARKATVDAGSLGNAAVQAAIERARAKKAASGTPSQ
ncbi:MAG: RnfABCDGE type electron transport complex subunit B [Rudaea sp.]